MIKIEKLEFSYGKKEKIIENLSMEIEEGTVYGLLGRNGAGKSTLLYLICGLLSPQGGRIEVDGYNPKNRATGFLEEVFIVPEEFYLPGVTLKEYIRVNAPFYPHFSMDDMERYLEIFELTPDLHLGKLSMGQKKKVFISFAMATNTNLLILDEPTNGLDISAKRNFRKAVAACMTDKKTIIISTHQLYDVDKILDHVIITDRKGILLNASMMEISSKYKFSFTTDRQRAENALISLEVPGGMNIVEYLDNTDEETDVNLESLYELVQKGK